MVNLLHQYDSANRSFLLLEHIKGGRLIDFVAAKRKQWTALKHFTQEEPRALKHFTQEEPRAGVWEGPEMIWGGEGFGGKGERGGVQGSWGVQGSCK